MGSSGGNDTTTTVEYPSWLVPYITGEGGHTGLLPEAERLFSEGPPGAYPGQTYAGLTGEQLTAQDLALNYATNDFWNMYNPLMGSYTSGLSGANPMDTSRYLDMYRGSAVNPYQSLVSTPQFNQFTGDVYGVGGAANPVTSAMMGRAGDFNIYNPAIYGESQTMNPFIQGVASLAGDENRYLGNLESMFTPGGNPYLDAMYGRGAESMTDAFNRAMSGVRDEAILSGQNIGAGQSTYQGGADFLSENLASGLGDLATQIYGGAYETDRNRALQAMTTAGQLDEAGMNRALQAMTTGGAFTQADLERRLTGAGMAADVYGADLNRQLQTLVSSGQLAGEDLNRALSAYTSAADISGQDMARNLQGLVEAGGMYSQDVSNMLSAAGIDLAGEELGVDQQAKLMSLAPQMMQLGLTPSQIYGDVGAQNQMMDQQAIDQAIQNWYYPYTSQMDHLGNFASILTGLSPGGTTTTTAPGGNPLATGLGSGLMGYGMASMLGMSNPWLWGLGMGASSIWG